MKLIAIEASGVTIANVTMTRAVDHLVHLVPPPRSSIRDIVVGPAPCRRREQFIRRILTRADGFVDGHKRRMLEFELTEEGRGHVESLGGTSCYTGGVTCMRAGMDGPVQPLRGLFCARVSVGTRVHFWQSERDTVVENNLIVNCARGIGVGLGRRIRSRALGRRRSGRLCRPSWRRHPQQRHLCDVPEYDTGIGLEQVRGRSRLKQ
jgi:hypothetical protein